MAPQKPVIQKTELYYLKIIAFSILSLAMLFIGEKITTELNKNGKSLWIDTFNTLSSMVTEL